MLLIEARNQRDVTQADLARLIAADPAQAVEPAATLGLPAPGTEDLATLIADARRSRDERTAMQRRVDAAADQRAAAAAGRRPTIALAGGVDYARPNPRIFPRTDRWDDSWDAGVNVSWSLWDGGRTSAEIAQAEGQTEAARQRLAEFDSVLAVDVRQRLLDVQSSRAAVAAAEDTVTAATEARRVVGERYRTGVIAQGDVLDADIVLLQAELDRTRALANVRLAEARLARATGR
jgi:outer membrane protein TolC